MKWDTPLKARVSFLEPILTQMPMDDDSTSGIGSVITFLMPLSRRARVIQSHLISCSMSMRHWSFSVVERVLATSTISFRQPCN